MLVLGLSYMVFIMLRYVPTVPILLRVFFFLNTLKLNVVKTVSVSIQIMIWLLVLISIINQFIVPEPFLYPWDESHLTVMYDTFNVLWNLISCYLVEDICVSICL